MGTDRLAQEVATSSAPGAGVPSAAAAGARPGASPPDADDEAGPAAAAAAAEAAGDAANVFDAGGAGDGEEGSGMGPDGKLLVLLSNCAFVRCSIVPAFAARCAHS